MALKPGADQRERMNGAQPVEVTTIVGKRWTAAAGVSSPTVYALYRSRAGILKALIEGAFFGESYAVLAEEIFSLLLLSPAHRCGD